jgi:transposase-like protein
MPLRDEIKIPFRCPSCGQENHRKVSGFWSSYRFQCRGCAGQFDFDEATFARQSFERSVSRQLNEVDQKIRRLEDEVSRLEQQLRSRR